ncbi:Na(+)/H(+) antiporter subunit D [Pelagicoccus sp. SDUM812002]|uniref:Na(+)/H(+) antiporter subunit D n=1 Tax=Pelagicoccus sp. SDUM812002 TaxID=3041266 RepID=UPI00280FFBE8|nr:Na(+)/H(+) antiporter subunit D [Pelagicoccus sp. SDUM812002]MDQ8185494.1 Na(+)/H(+) antiporter subunit D [Pelagicoccus sp. SDUM812002]
MFELAPAFWLLSAAALAAILPFKAVRAALCVLMPLVGLWQLWSMGIGASSHASLAGFELTLYSVTKVNFVFAVIFLLISSIAGVYAWHVSDRGQQVAALSYASGALGVTLAGDFLTLLLFWELMAVASAWLVFARREESSIRAGVRYLLVHVAGGSLLFGGIILFYGQTGTLSLQALSPEMGASAWLILAGVALNVALPPLHAWLPDAYPRATITGAIFMSALTTKSAVYVLLVLFPGWDLLIYMGLFMALYGVVYAVLANDIRQILAYHIISQVGYMVAGVGIGTALSMNGTAAHAFSHILYKALLFMGAGAVIQATGVSKLSDLGGLAPKMKGVVWLFMIGAFSISGFPLFNGFISKSMIVSAAGEAHYYGIMLGLLLASVGTFLHTGLKIPVFTFWGKDQKLEVKPIPGNMYVAMGLVAFGCTFFGVYPQALYAMLPFDAEYHPYTAYHLVEATQILTFTFIGFWVLRAKLAGEPYLALDTDWFYRRGAPVAQAVIVKPVNAFFGAGAKVRDGIAAYLASSFGNPRAWFGVNKGPSDRFDPDLERAPLGAGLAFILLVFIALFASIAILG